MTCISWHIEESRNLPQVVCRPGFLASLAPQAFHAAPASTSKATTKNTGDIPSLFLDLFDENAPQTTSQNPLPQRRYQWGYSANDTTITHQSWMKRSANHTGTERSMCSAQEVAQRPVDNFKARPAASTTSFLRQLWLQKFIRESNIPLILVHWKIHHLQFYSLLCIEKVDFHCCVSWLEMRDAQSLHLPAKG